METNKTEKKGESKETNKTEEKATVEEDSKERGEEGEEKRKRPVVVRGRYRGEEDGVASGADAARALRTLKLRPYTKEDAYFTDVVGTEFVFGQRPDADIEELNSLFASVGFPRRDPTRLQRALVNSHLIVWVLSRHDVTGPKACRRGQCVGFARATSDKVFNATIWDVVVSPLWQGSGIGRGMVERLVRQLVSEEIANVSLYSEPSVVGLYQDCGFEGDPGGTTGMALRQYSVVASSSSSWHQTPPGQHLLSMSPREEEGSSS